MSVFRWKNGVVGALDATNSDTADVCVGDVGSPGIPDAIAFKAGGGPGAAPSAGVEKTKSPTLTTLVSFTGLPGGFVPQGSLIADASGNLFGTTSDGGTTTTARYSRSWRRSTAMRARRSPSSASRAPMGRSWRAR